MACEGGRIDGGGLANVLERVGVEENGLARRLPHRSWATRRDRARHRREHGGLRVAGREGELDPALQLLDADGNLHERAPDGLEGGAAPARALRCRTAQRMQQPVGAHVQEEPELVGLPARAGGLVGSRPALHVLDQVLGVAARAEHLLVERLAAPFEVGDDEAHVSAHGRRLDACDELARPAPLAGPVGQLMEAAHRRLPLRAPHVALGAPGCRDLQQLGVDGKADDVVAAHGFQQRQRGLAAIVAVAPHQDLDVRPMLADADDDVAQDLGYLLARGALAGPQQRQHRLAREAVEDVDRLEAGAVVVRVEECELLLAMHGIVGVVDVEHDCAGRSREAAAVEIDLAEPDARQRTPVGQVLEPGQRRLAHQIAAAVGCAADGDLQGGIGPQRVDVIAVLVAGGDHDHPRHRHLGVAVPHAARIAIVARAVR